MKKLVVFLTLIINIFFVSQVLAQTKITVSQAKGIVSSYLEAKSELRTSLDLMDLIWEEEDSIFSLLRFYETSRDSAKSVGEYKKYKKLVRKHKRKYSLISESLSKQGSLVIKNIKRHRKALSKVEEICVFLEKIEKNQIEEDKNLHDDILRILKDPLKK